VGRKVEEDTHLIEYPQTHTCAGRWPFKRRSEVLATKELYCTEESPKIEFLGQKKGQRVKERWEGKQHRNTPAPSAPLANRACPPCTSAPGVALVAFCGRLSPRWPALARSAEHRTASPAPSRYLRACIRRCVGLSPKVVSDHRQRHSGPFRSGFTQVASQTSPKILPKSRNFPAWLEVTDITFPVCSQPFNSRCPLTTSHLASTLHRLSFSCSPPRSRSPSTFKFSSRLFAHGDENFSFKGGNPNLGSENFFGILISPTTIVEITWA
jgi:hypothetical protein